MTPDQLDSVKNNVAKVIHNAAEKYGGIPADERLFDLAAELEAIFNGYGFGDEKKFGLAAAGELAARALGEPVSAQYQSLIIQRDLTEKYSRRG